ncbi:hypothetical protein CCYA_CCYA10G2931 [Cyanidiococcus yangmingshanensis]|nr:hypothetical protein CCYA_CCYA10G2931 [Cyanidiococcus yangmingshanensis]
MKTVEKFLFVSSRELSELLVARLGLDNNLKRASLHPRGRNQILESFCELSRRSKLSLPLSRKTQNRAKAIQRSSFMELCSQFSRESGLSEERQSVSEPQRRVGIAKGYIERLKQTSLPPKHFLFAELFGTSLLTTFSCLIGISGTSLAPFLAGAMISCLVLAFIPTSGALLNPFVVLALFATKRLDIASSIVYVGIQLLGGVLGASLFAILATPDMYDQVAGGTVSVRTDMALWQGACWEFFLTFTLISLISAMGFAPFELSSENDPNRWIRHALFALLIGLLVGLLVGVGGSVTGCSMNAARAFGPLAIAQLRVWAGTAAPMWLESALHGHIVVYWLAPACGSLVGALLMEHAFVSPWLGRPPKSLLSDIRLYAERHMTELRSYGSAGLVAYGILNTLLYGSVFTYSVLFVFASQPGAVAKAWAASWVASQATKPIRLFLAVAMAPVIRRFLARLPWNRHSS